MTYLDMVVAVININSVNLLLGARQLRPQLW